MSRSFVWSAGVAFSLLLTAASLAEESGSSTGSALGSWFDSIMSLTGEYAVEETYVADADVRRGNRAIRGFTEHNTIVRFVLTPRIESGVLRVGMEMERFSFGFPNRTPLPNTLQSANLILGIDTQFSDSIVARFQAQPGIYNTSFVDVSDDFNMPFIAGGTYIYDPSLQFVVGVSVDVERQYPVIPAAGIRWKVCRQWVLNAVLPTPRIEFEAARNITLYVGANIKQTNFRVREDFGDKHGNPRLNHAVLSYSEVRTGLGVDWKITNNVTLTAEAGYQPYRSFDFYRADVRFHEDGSAPYGMIALRGAF